MEKNQMNKKSMNKKKKTNKNNNMKIGKKTTTRKQTRGGSREYGEEQRKDKVDDLFGVSNVNFWLSVVMLEELRDRACMERETNN